MSKENDDMPFDENGKIDYHKWMQINAFIKKLHENRCNIFNGKQNSKYPFN